MGQSRGASWIAALAILGAGCSGGDDGGLKGDAFEGLYQVTGETENDSGCGVEGPAVTPFDPYFRLEIDSFFGQRYLGYVHCTDSATCDEESDLFGSFYEKVEGNWTSVLTFASHTEGTDPQTDPDMCYMGETIRTLTGDPELAVEITSVMSTTSAAGLSEAECLDGDLEVLVDEYRDQLVCENLDVLRADRVPE